MVARPCANRLGNENSSASVAMVEDRFGIEVHPSRDYILHEPVALGRAIIDSMNSHSNRRAFVSSSIAALAASSMRAAPELREIRTAFIGFGNRGTQLTTQ